MTEITVIRRLYKKFRKVFCRFLDAVMERDYDEERVSEEITAFRHPDREVYRRERKRWADFGTS